MTSSADPLEPLLAHADWLRGLARQLVGAAAADDMVQDTFEAALGSPPDPARAPRPWLARVLRNVTRMQFRAQGRRQRREQAVVQLAPSSAAGPDAAVARLETHQQLVELVRALVEPYRGVLIRHYFDGRSLAEIAREDGVPEATVRWRHKEAVARLRAALDQRAGGDRHAWLAALAPLTASPAASHPVALALGGLLMKKLAVVVVLSVVAGVAVWRLAARDGGAAPSPSASAASVPGAPPSSPAAPTSPDARPTPPGHVTQLAPVERQRLAEQIARSRSARPTASSPPSPAPSSAVAAAPELPPKPVDKATLRAAMHEVIPFLERCYTEALPTLASPNLEIAAHLTLEGDPDVGTIIDAQQLFDHDQHPLPAQFDDCVRSTLQSLSLPPLAEGDRIEVTYPFAFSNGP